MNDFPDEVKQVLNKNNFNNTYIWNTRDFDLLPLFHKGNVVLIGDAAHLALPFTSAGTTNAIQDAATLSECITQAPNIEFAFQDYYNKRSLTIKNHIQQGRDLKQIFLEPEKYSERGFIYHLFQINISLSKKLVLN